jgi:hypothetical protein
MNSVPKSNSSGKYGQRGNNSCGVSATSQDDGDNAEVDSVPDDTDGPVSNSSESDGEDEDYTPTRRSGRSVVGRRS